VGVDLAAFSENPGAVVPTAPAKATCYQLLTFNKNASFEFFGDSHQSQRSGSKLRLSGGGIGPRRCYGSRGLLGPVEQVPEVLLRWAEVWLPVVRHLFEVVACRCKAVRDERWFGEKILKVGGRSGLKQMSLDAQQKGHM
jgi:hypothetical protein